MFYKMNIPKVAFFGSIKSVLNVFFEKLFWVLFKL